MPASDAKPTPQRTEAGKTAAEARDQRLSEALRANLKRRKSQARGRAETDEEPAGGKSA